MNGDPSRDHLLERLSVFFVAIETALNRHQDVMSIIWYSADRTEAVAAIKDLLGVGDLQATAAVLDLQWSTRTREIRRDISIERRKDPSVPG